MLLFLCALPPLDLNVWIRVWSIDILHIRVRHPGRLRYFRSSVPAYYARQ